MTIAQLIDIVEPLPDDLKVEWGCVDTSIPKKVYKSQASNVATFKEFLASDDVEPYRELATPYEGKLLIIRQWLVTDDSIIFYMGYADEE